MNNVHFFLYIRVIGKYLISKLFLLQLDFGSLSQCEMLYQTNLFAVIAGGRFPKYSQNTVLIYDALLKKFVMELNCSSAVKAVRLRRNKLVNIHIINY